MLLELLQELVGDPNTVDPHLLQRAGSFYQLRPARLLAERKSIRPIREIGTHPERAAAPLRPHRHIGPGRGGL
jgi:hypothetical protein